MRTAIFPEPLRTQPAAQPGVRLIITLALAVWFVLVLALGVSGAFLGRPGRPPVSLAIGFAAPLAVFFASLRFSRSFREFVHSLDLRLIAGIQAWRWAGLGFIFLYAHRILPAVFALPAGIGDMAVGLSAPWMAVALMRQPDFAASGAFVRWNVLGMLDLVIAMSIGTVSAMLATGAPGEISTVPMATPPLLLVPAFLVPFFMMLHCIALIQGRRIRSRTGH